MAAHDLINAAVKANESAMRTAIKQGYPVQLPANQYLPKAMNGNIDVIHLGQFADLDAGFDEYRKQQAAQPVEQDFSDLDAGFAEWSAAQGGQTSVDAPTSVTGTVGTGSTSVGGQSIDQRSTRANTGHAQALDEIPQLDNMAVPVTAKTTTKTAKTATKAEKTAAKEVKQANSTLSKADKALQTAQKKQTVAENNLRKKLDRAENEAQKADAMRSAAKVTKKGNTTVIEPAQNVQQTKRKMRNLAKEEARAQADYAKAQETVRKADIAVRKAADRQQATLDRVRAQKAATQAPTAPAQATRMNVIRDSIDQSVANEREAYSATATPMAQMYRGSSGRTHSGSGRTGYEIPAPDLDAPIEQLIPTGDIETLVPTDDVRDQIERRQIEANAATSKRAKNTPEMNMMQSAVRADAMTPKLGMSRLAVLSDPNRRLTKEEQDEAEQLIRAYNKEHHIHGGNDGYYGGPNDPLSPEYLEYAAIQRLKAKTTGGAIGAGASDAYSLINELGAKGVTKVADLVTGDPNNPVSQSIRQAGDLTDQSMQAAQTQAPLSYAGGQMAGKMSQYAATNPYFDSIAEASGLTGAAKFALNQGAQLAQDYVVSDLPQLYEDLADENLTTQQALKNFGVNILQDAAGNLAMGALSDYVIPSLVNRFGRGAADAQRAVSNTPAPVDDSLDAALFGAGIKQDLTRGTYENIPELGRGLQETNIAEDQWRNFFDQMKGTDAGTRAGSEAVEPYTRALREYDAGRATLDDVDEAFNQAQFNLKEAGLSAMDPAVQRNFNPNYSGPTAFYDNAFRRYGETYSESAGAYREAQRAYDAVIGNPDATREEIIAAHDQLVKAADRYDSKIRAGETAPRNAELSQQIAELKRSKGADKGTGNMKVYADPEWVKKRFGTKNKTAQDRLKGTGIILVDDPSKASKNIPMMGQADLESFLDDAIRMQSERNGLAVSFNTGIGVGKNSDQIRKSIYAEIAERTNEALESRGYRGLSTLSLEDQAREVARSEDFASFLTDNADDYRAFSGENEAALEETLRRIKSGEITELPADAYGEQRLIRPGETFDTPATAVDEIPQMRDIAEDVGIPRAADETVSGEIPGMEETAESVSKLSKESADELQAEVKSMKRSFNSKIKAVKDQNNEYALAFKDAFDRFSKDPTPETYAEARAALNEYVDHSNTVRAQALSGEWYDRKFDSSSYSESFVKRFDELAEKYGFKTSDAAEEIPTLGRQAEEVAEELPTLSRADTLSRTDEVTDVARNGGGGTGNNDVPALEGPIGRAKTSKTYTNTGKRGRGWNEAEYKAYTDAQDYQYETVSERESVERAWQTIREEGADAAKERLLNSENLSGSDIDALMSLWRVQVSNARAAEAAGEDATELWKESNRIFKKIQTESTHNAQALQALAKWSRNTPEGMLAQADNIINGRAGRMGRAGRPDDVANEMEKIYNKYFKGKGVELSEDFQKDFLDLAERYQKSTDESERKILMAQMGKLVNTQLPAKLPEKIKTYLMDSMLGNFRTLITRNAGGNIGFNAVEQTTERPLAALIDSIIGKKTGRRTQAGLTKAAFSDYLSGFKKGLADEWADFKTIKGKAGSSIHTARSGESTLEEAIANNRQVFSTFLFDKADQLVKHGLSVGDRPFYEAVYKETLGDYTRMYKAGKMGKDIQSLPEDVFKRYAEAAAKMNALAACYQDDSALAKGFMELRNGVAGLSKGLTGVDILSQFAMPFVKTPANIINRAVEYSPLGIVKNAVNTAKDLRANAAIAKAAAKRGEDVAKGIAGLSPAQQNRLANETARNILGTGLFVGGIAAADKGVISGGFSDDKDEAAIQRSNGMQEYALHKDGAYRSIDWIPVLGNDLVAAAAFQEAMENSEGTFPEQLEAGLAAGLESQFDTSMLQGLENLFSSNEYNRNQGVKGIVPNVVSTIKSGATQAIPSLVRQAAAFGDDYKRQLGGDDPNDYYFNSVKNAIPGIRESLEPKVDNQGELVEQNAGRNAFQKFFDNFLSPWTTTYEKHTPLDEEAKRLSDSVGSDIAFVTTPSRADITTETFTPSDKDFTNYRQEVGALKKEIGEGLIQSDFYQQFSDADKAVALQEVYSAAKAVARKPYVKIDPTTRYPQVYERDGVEGVLKYINADVNSKKINFDKQGGPVSLSQANVRGKFNAISATGLSENEQGNIYYNSINADEREKLKDFYEDVGDTGMYQLMRGKAIANEDGKGSIKIQEILDYATSYPDVSEEVVKQLAPSDTPGTFKKEGDVWCYYSKGKLKNTGNKKQYDYEAPEIDYSITRGPAREAEEETAVEEPEATTQQTSNAELDPVTGRPVVPSKQTAQADTEIDPITGRPKLKNQSTQGEIPKLEPNGDATWNNSWSIENSKSYGRFRQVDPSYNASDYARVYNAMDTDNSGKLKKAEIQNYLDAMSGVDEAYRWAMFNAFAQSNWSNPYKKK